MNSNEVNLYQIQKGILQICKGLSFLHSSAQLVHTNVSPETIIINGAVRDTTPFYLCTSNHWQCAGRLEDIRAWSHHPSLDWREPNPMGVSNF